MALPQSLMARRDREMQTAVTPHASVWVTEAHIGGWVLWEGGNPHEITGYALGPIDWKLFQEETGGASNSQLTTSDELKAQLSEAKFRRLRAQWERECGITSSMSKIVMAD